MKDQFFRITAAAALVMAALVLFTSLAAYRVFADSNIPVTIDIPVTYIVNGNDEAAGGDTVTLTADDALSPMPGGTEAGKKTISIRKEGTYSFGDMYFEKPGVHWYTITRKVTEKKGVTKDGSVFRAKVIALNDGHGYVIVYKEGSDEKSELVYTDRVAPETGDVSGITLYACIAVAAAVSLAAFAAFRMRKKKD